MATKDVVILLIGLHGTGKSTFTRAATGERVVVGNGVDPCTTKCKKYSVVYRGKQFAIIDTPGLADRNTVDENLDILQQIADQLHKLGQDHVTGVIYFHSIEGMRIRGVDMDNIRILEAICGQPFFSRVAFVTTRWDLLKDDQYSGREIVHQSLQQLCRNLLPNSPDIFRFLNTSESHQPILDYFFDQESYTEGYGTCPQLLFAQELERYRWERKPEKAVRKTAAGKQVVAQSRKVRKGICSFL
ncbi:P-loop containing nucleoside triphosphate hydrolase protein [Cercophora newfieldiana]|uniref:P-loop containing nucleoside triphosphate hydrolase protein n=1 Tax=Cercophora newfieldiana TaxID=92897 RepID=A0AA39Y8T4_9PEZI|nr:P-loop containing nucleoside triphosphate hydrolase protein [Cercophora newfieldiana]